MEYTTTTWPTMWTHSVYTLPGGSTRVLYQWAAEPDTSGGPILCDNGLDCQTNCAGILESYLLTEVSVHGIDGLHQALQTFSTNVEALSNRDRSFRWRTWSLLRGYEGLIRHVMQFST